MLTICTLGPLQPQSQSSSQEQLKCHSSPNEPHARKEISSWFCILQRLPPSQNCPDGWVRWLYKSLHNLEM